ncbi:MAG: CorA family divalent cation transporter [Solirubrobacterales bacterium]
MAEMMHGLGARERKRIAELRENSTFFWTDVSLAETSSEQLGPTFEIPAAALGPLADFSPKTPPSRKFHVDGKRVVFTFGCFLEGAEEGARLTPIEVHVVVSGDYLLTVHEEQLSLPELLDPALPEGRSEQYIVYAILDAMVATGFDALNEAEVALEGLQLMSTDLRAARVRMATLRAINSRLAGMRRRVGPQRGIFERISEEVGRVEGLEPDNERYFERIYGQLNRLVEAIDAAADGMAKLIDLRLNETIYWLTVVATIFLPLTFVTGFFGMNFAWMVQRIDTGLAFIALGIGAPVLGAALTLLLVRHRGTPVEPDRQIPVPRVRGIAPPRPSR